MKNFKLKVSLLFVALLALPVATYAYSVEHGNSVYVSKDKTIEGNFYVAGADITIDGHVTGDVFCAGQVVNINGVVDGDVICAGQTISVNGNVGGSIRALGSSIDIRGKVARGISAAGASINFAKDASIGWDALLAAANVNMSGKIGRSLLGAGANFVLGGSVAGNTSLYIDNNDQKNQTILTVLDGATLGGTLNYTSKADASLNPKAQVKGKVTHNLPPVASRDKSGTSPLLGIFLIATFSALLVGYLLVGVWKKPMQDIVIGMTTLFWSSVGVGAVFTIMAPIIALLFAITIIGFRLTLLTIWSWLIVLMLSKVVAAIAIGSMLLNKVLVSKKDSIGWVVAIGIIVSWTIFYIPFIGWIVSLVATWWGAGAIIIYLKKSYDMNKEAVK